MKVASIRVHPVKSTAIRRVETAEGGFAGLGMSPGSTMRLRFRFGTGTGIALSSVEEVG